MNSTGFPKDRKELILQYLSGLASRSQSSDQMVVKEFLSCLGSSNDTNDALDYLKSIQKMKGEWYNQQGKQAWLDTHFRYVFYLSLQLIIFIDISYILMNYQKDYKRDFHLQTKWCPSIQVVRSISLHSEGKVWQIDQQ